MNVCLCLQLSQGIERQLATEQGSKLDTYELEVAAERGDVLRDLAEFQLASVSAPLLCFQGWGGLSVGVGCLVVSLSRP
jgi:hypothetical protein